MYRFEKPVRVIERNRVPALLDLNVPSAAMRVYVSDTLAFGALAADTQQETLDEAAKD